jgi:Cu2+-exporting ATPase
MSDQPADDAVGESPWVNTVSPGRLSMVLLVPGIHCAGCISRIEKMLEAHAAVFSARVNFSTKRVRVEWREGDAASQELIDLLAGGGFEATPIMPDEAGMDHEKAEMSALLRALAVAGFAAGNIMLLSVSVWSGAEAATQDLFQYISALIAIPAIAYAGQPFFRSALSALSARRLNMDVPISLAVLLALALSLFETMAGNGETYFDAGVMLLFFLLIGRTLDRMMRARARSAASGLLALKPDVATIVDADGANRIVASHQLHPGMNVRVAAGERIPADGRIVEGSSDVDCALLTGESLPETVAPGSSVHAGIMNMTAPLTMEVEAAGGETLVSEIAATMEAAEQNKARYVRLADKAARIYAPAVHLAALATFLGWLAMTGGDWHQAALPAIAVLIITCPCALGLAVPAVQVVASGLLFARGILLKDGGGLERLAEIDSAVFDKTGTLTLGRPQMLGTESAEPTSLAVAAGLASASSHPLSRALARAAGQAGITPARISDIAETPGSGLTGTYAGSEVRLGSRAWCGIANAPDEGGRDGPELWLSAGADGTPERFRFSDETRPRAAASVQALADRGLTLGILSGDRPENVRRVAAGLGIDDWRASLSPQDKLDHIERLAANGRKVFVVGDGLNDGPALAAGHVSMAPSSASDLGQTAADLVFLGDSLQPVADAHDIARKAGRLVRQNFAFAAVYNVIAVPLAAAGLATPLIAAVAMSTSSLIVIANALRLRLIAGRDAADSPASVPAGAPGATNRREAMA